MSSAETEGVPGARVGDVLGGKYRVEKVLGAGGMGVVVAATHLQLDEKVAIKFLLPDAAKSADVVSRFQREARAAVKIKSEHVARVSDVGQLDNGAPYMVMEYLQGKDLADTLEDLTSRRQMISVPAAVEYVLQACEALAEAHAAGIVHRDLKPANLFLTSRADGSACVKVLDFGISKIVGSLSMPGMTRTTAVMGSPLYMSPEQMKSSKDVDHRSDIWSLGAILYELLSGNPPFIADTMPQLCMMILQEPLGPLHQFRSDVPPQLEAVIRKCQEKDANHRFQNVAELSAALAPFVTGRARLSAERIADVLRSATHSRTSLPQGATPAPPAGAPVPPTHAMTGAGYGAPQPTVPGAPYGSSSPNLGPPAYGQTGYPAQAQTGGNFSQSNPSQPPIGSAATIVGSPSAHGLTPHPGAISSPHVGPPHGPPMGANTASSWEGTMGGAKKKSSAGIIIGAVAGIALLAGIGIAVALMGGGSGDNASAATALPTPTSTETKPEVAPTPATVSSEIPTPAATASSDPTPITTGKLPGGKTPPTPGKPTATATATAAVTVTLPPIPTLPTSKPPQPGGLDDDRK